MRLVQHRHALGHSTGLHVGQAAVGQRLRLEVDVAEAPGPVEGELGPRHQLGGVVHVAAHGAERRIALLDARGLVARAGGVARAYHGRAATLLPMKLANTSPKRAHAIAAGRGWPAAVKPRTAAARWATAPSRSPTDIASSASCSGAGRISAVVRRRYATGNFLPRARRHPTEGRPIPGGLDDDVITGTDRAAVEHPRVGAARTAVEVVVDAAEVPVGEPLRVLCTRRRERGHLREHAAHQQLHTGPDRRPVDPRDRHVLARGSGVQAVSLGSECVDHVLRPEAQRLERSAVVSPLGLPVADEAAAVDRRGPECSLRDAAVGGVDLDDRSPLCRRPRAERVQAACDVPHICVAS